MRRTGWNPSPTVIIAAEQHICLPPRSFRQPLHGRAPLCLLCRRSRGEIVRWLNCSMSLEYPQFPFWHSVQRTVLVSAANDKWQDKPWLLGSFQNPVFTFLWFLFFTFLLSHLISHKQTNKQTAQKALFFFFCIKEGTEVKVDCDAEFFTFAF